MRLKLAVYSLLVCLVCAPASWAQQATAAANETTDLRLQVEQMQKALTDLQQRLAAQEAKSATLPAAPEAGAAAPAEGQAAPTNAELSARLDDLDSRVQKSELKNAIDRINWSGEFRTESNSIFGTVPDRYNGIGLQSALAESVWLMSPTSVGGLGFGPIDPSQLPLMFGTPANYQAFLGSQIVANPAQFQLFTGNLTFKQLQASFGAFTPLQQQQFMGFLLSGPKASNPYFVPGYQANSNFIPTVRVRLNAEAKVSDNVNVAMRLGMYKVFGDSTGVQVFNGLPTAFAIDGTTVGVPSGDWLRVERAFFNWKDIAGSHFYFSVGRRPSTEGPPMNYRNDDPRGGTPSGALIDYQFDGATLGYHIGDHTALRLCYGLGFDGGWGNGQLLQMPADRVRSVHFLGANVDLWDSDKMLIQFTAAKAWNVSDGFASQLALDVNPVTGQPLAPGNDVNGGSVSALPIMRFSPDANLGNIFLYGVNATRKVGGFDVYASGNWDSLRPNQNSSPFGGLGSDPLQPNSNHDGYMVLVGARYNLPNNRTKIGFEYNHGSKFWFNFAQAEDDMLQPKTSARGNVYEAFLTHRINPHFTFKADYQRFLYQWSGSGMQVGAPKPLDNGIPQVLGFPTYDQAHLITVGLNAKF